MLAVLFIPESSAIIISLVICFSLSVLLAIEMFSRNDQSISKDACREVCSQKVSKLSVILPIQSLSSEAFSAVV